MPSLAFIDTETTSLRHDRRAWEIAVILRDEDGDENHQWFVDIDDLDLGNADLNSLKIGRFHDRHPQASGSGRTAIPVRPEVTVLEKVEAVTRGAVLVGAVPNFDSEVLGNRMRANGICPSWHYHLCDAETLAVGYLCHEAGTLRLEDDITRDFLEPPWDSEALSKAIGVDPAQFDRHTALGDAQWARAIWDTIHAGVPVKVPVSP